MRIISSDEIDACLDDRSVIETLRNAYRSTAIAPMSEPLMVARPDGAFGEFTCLPAWTDFASQGHADRGYIGCRIALTLPGTPEATGPASSLYLLFSGTRGQPLALIDGMRLGLWRGCAVHALAASYLAREDATRLLVLGDDPRLPRLLSAYASVRKLTSVLLAGATPQTLKRLAATPTLTNLHIGTTDDIHGALEGADMICIADAASDGEEDTLLRRFDPPPGCHVDVIAAGLVLPGQMLDEARLFAMDRSDLPSDGLEWAADLGELARGEKAGRRYYGQRTLFTAGAQTGLADFALAGHIFLRS